eukprot:5756647-Pyramimonas_sp.AAC.1
MRGMCCGAAWTLDRAISCGYQLDSDRCPLCRATPDSILHRLWHCPAVQDARDELVQIDIPEAARAIDPACAAS